MKEYNEKIDEFLRGRLTQEEEREFKDLIKKDPDLKKQVQEHLILIRGIRQVKQKEDKMTVASIKLAAPRRKWSLYRVVGIAAMFIVVFVIGHDAWVNYETNAYIQSTSAEYLTKMSETNARGVGNTELEIRLRTLFADVKEGRNIATSISALEKLNEVATDEYVDEEDDYVEQIQWFLAVAYIKDNQQDKCARLDRFFAVERLSKDSKRSFVNWGSR